MYELMMEMKASPEKLVQNISVNSLETLLSLDGQMIGNMLLSVAAEFLKNIDHAEDLLGFKAGAVLKRAH